MSETIIDPARYDIELQRKLERFKGTLEGLNCPEIDVYDSAPSGFRLRAEFRIWHEGGRAHYAMNRPGEKRPYIISSFPIAGELIARLMTPLLDAINANLTLSHKLFSLEFLTTLSGEVLVTLIYHRSLDDHWQQAAEALQTELKIMIIGRSRKQKRVLERDYVTETLHVDGMPYHYQQVESGFTQPNARVNEKMLGWASACCAQIATEGSTDSVDNVTVVRMSSEEFTQALNGERPFRRLAEINLRDFNFTTIFVDPPRAGLDDGTLELARRFETILYVSCNPETLRSNLDVLNSTHQIVRTAIFDQFPWTHHLESGVLLKRRKSA